MARSQLATTFSSIRKILHNVYANQDKKCQFYVEISLILHVYLKPSYENTCFYCSTPYRLQQVAVLRQTAQCFCKNPTKL